MTLTLDNHGFITWIFRLVCCGGFNRNNMGRSIKVLSVDRIFRFKQFLARKGRIISIKMIVYITRPICIFW